jgi:hypothetical protein
MDEKYKQNDQNSIDKFHGYCNRWLLITFAIQY